MKNIRWTKERVIEQFNRLEDKDNFLLETPYEIKCRTSKIRIQCKRCNYVWYPNINNFFQNHARCNICNKNIWTHERFWSEFNKLPDKNLYTVEELPKKLSARTKINLICNNKHIFSPTIQNFFYHGTRCMICSRGEPWSKFRFLKEIEALDDKDNFIFSDYEDINKVTSTFSVYCKKCTHIWKATPTNFFQKGTRCKKCVMNAWSNARVEKEFNNTKDSKKFSLIFTEKIIHGQSCFKVKCKYGHIWKTTPSRFFTAKKRCPLCNISRGERKICEILEFNNIIFENQKRFKNCKLKYTLPFDFYLLDYNVLIEFQGKQHFEVANFNSNLEINKQQFIDLQHRDSIKRNWVISNGYTLLEIRYDEMNQIESKLMDLLNVYYI
ncbi:MAG TPA: hypothetical protein PKN22_05370 [Taishania sp.]|nr:hypothetical protein [Taishania sp.]